MARAADAEVIVVGAGVVGLACAERLATAGRDVLVLEAGSIGGGATGAALGALMPHAPTAETPLTAAQRHSLAALPAWIARVEDRSGRACGYRRVGRVEILPSANASAAAEAKIAAAAQRWADLSDGDTPLRRASAADARNLVPAMADAPHGCLIDRVTAQLDPWALLHALASACRAMGVATVETTPVHGLEADRDGIAAATPNGRWRARWVVLATGCGVPGRSLVPDIAIRAVKGEAMVLPDLGEPTPRPVVSGPGGFALTRPDGVHVGSTSDKTAPRDPTVTREGLSALMGRARKLLAIAPEQRPKRVWSGFRPAAPDGQPVVGAHPETDRVILALGHFKTGLSLAPGTAETVAAMLDGDGPAWPWTAFAPARLRRARSAGA